MKKSETLKMALFAFFITIYIVFTQTTIACTALKGVIVNGEGNSKTEAVNSAIIMAISQVRGVKVIASSQSQTHTIFNNNNVEMQAITSSYVSSITKGVVSSFEILNTGNRGGLYHIKLKVFICTDPIIQVNASDIVIKTLLPLLSKNYIITDRCDYGCDYTIMYSSGTYYVKNSSDYTVCADDSLLDTINCISGDKYQLLDKYVFIFTKIKRHASIYKIKDILRKYFPVVVDTVNIDGSKVTFQLSIPQKYSPCDTMKHIITEKILDGKIVSCTNGEAVVRLYFE